MEIFYLKIPGEARCLRAAGRQAVKIQKKIKNITGYLKNILVSSAYYKESRRKVLKVKAISVIPFNSRCIGLFYRLPK